MQPLARLLQGELAATAGMAGDDDAGHSFAARYTPTATGLARALSRGSLSISGVSGGLLQMAANYWKADSHFGPLS